MEVKSKNYLIVVQKTKEEKYVVNHKLVKYKNLVFKDETNELIDQRVIYNNVVDYEKIIEGAKIPGEIVELSGYKIIKFRHEKTLSEAIWNQKYKYVKYQDQFINLLDAAKKSENTVV